MNHQDMPFHKSEQMENSIPISSPQSSENYLLKDILKKISSSTQSRSQNRTLNSLSESQPIMKLTISSKIAKFDVSPPGDHPINGETERVKEEKKKVRLDMNGRVIEKGSDYKVTFKDEITQHKLYEIHYIPKLCKDDDDDCCCCCSLI